MAVESGLACHIPSTGWAKSAIHTATRAARRRLVPEAALVLVSCSRQESLRVAPPCDLKPSPCLHSASPQSTGPAQVKENDVREAPLKGDGDSGIVWGGVH